MRYTIFFVIFLTSITSAMNRSQQGTTVIVQASMLRLNLQQGAANHTDKDDSRTCCSVLGNLVVNAPGTLYYISADYVMRRYIQTLEYLGDQINPDPNTKSKTE